MVTRRQLLDAGWHSSRIDRERRAKRLHVVHAGVYAVGHRAIDDRGRWLAATLACGGVLSHHSAAALWELSLGDHGLTRVIASVRHRRQSSAISLS